MSRPKVHGDRVTTQIRLPVDLHDRLQQAAEERDVSVNFLVVKALEDYLARLIPTGLEVWWCRSHSAPAWGGEHDPQCVYWYWQEDKGLRVAPCHMVPMRLVAR